MPKRPRQKSVTFDKRYARFYASQKANRYTVADVSRDPESYALYFRSYFADAPDFIAYVLESAGPTLQGQMEWLYTRFSQQYKVMNIMEKVLETRALSPQEQELYDENRVLGADFASLFVMHRLFLTQNHVDDSPISTEDAGILIYELSSASPTYQFLMERYWYPKYFDEAIRALRNEESVDEAASYILLGGR